MPDKSRQSNACDHGCSLECDWLEQELLEGFESADLPPSKTFWKDLRTELHQEHKNVGPTT